MSVEVVKRRSHRSQSPEEHSRRHSVIDRDSLWQVNDDTLICRCEDVTVGDILGGVADGVVTPSALRSVTRFSMGRCQGRYCEAAVEHLMAEMALGSVAAIDTFTP